MNKETTIIGSIALGVIAVFVGFALSSNKSSADITGGTKVDNTVLIRESSHKSTADLKSVTLVEFGDYQCPACGAAHPAIKQIANEYKDKVTVIFRNFPLPQHGNALITAEAAEAAADQGKFWEMHDKLYENQAQWSNNTQALDLMTNYAKDLGLNQAQFKQAVEQKKFEDRIMADLHDGETLGVNATPTIFINGVKFTAPATYQNLKQALDAALQS